MRFACAVMALSTLAVASDAQTPTIFRGQPEVRVTTVGARTESARLPALEASNYTAVVSLIQGRYYWASRENVELVRHEAGGFVTFTAVNGAGYIRVIKPSMRASVATMGDAEKEYQYIEQLTVGLSVITYYGRAIVADVEAAASRAP